MRNRLTGALIDISGQLPEIEKDIILYLPKTFDEFDLGIEIQTVSQLLGEPVERNGALVFTAGTLMTVKSVGRVQLMVHSIGYCSDISRCKDFAPEDVCSEFEELPFSQIYPVQL